MLLLQQASCLHSTFLPIDPRDSGWIAGRHTPALPGVIPDGAERIVFGGGGADGAEGGTGGLSTAKQFCHQPTRPRSRGEESRDSIGSPSCSRGDGRKSKNSTHRIGAGEV